MASRRFCSAHASGVRVAALAEGEVQDDDTVAAETFLQQQRAAGELHVACVRADRQNRSRRLRQILGGGGKDRDRRSDQKASDKHSTSVRAAGAEV